VWGYSKLPVYLLPQPSEHPGNADNADNADIADNAGNADNADSADDADSADIADNADNADNADSADNADNADNAGNADLSDDEFRRSLSMSSKLWLLGGEVGSLLWRVEPSQLVGEVGRRDMTQPGVCQTWTRFPYGAIERREALTRL
jgi:hypothetical protein